MKTTTILLASMSAAFCSAGETQLSVTGAEGLKGTATLINKIQEDGTKYVRLSMRLVYTDGQTAEILQESTYSPLGEPIRMLQTSKSGSKKTSIVVTFSEEGAQVVSDKGDGPKTNFVVTPGGSTKNPTEFWFCKDLPKKGQVAEYYTFRVSEQAWVKAKSRYEGKKEIVVDGRRVNANFVQLGEIKSYTDDKGDPYRVELGSLKLERTGTD